MREAVAEQLVRSTQSAGTSREFPQNSENFFWSSHVHALRPCRPSSSLEVEQSGPSRWASTSTGHSPALPTASISIASPNEPEKSLNQRSNQAQEFLLLRSVAGCDEKGSDLNVGNLST